MGICCNGLNDCEPELSLWGIHLWSPGTHSMAEYASILGRFSQYQTAARPVSMSLNCNRFCIATGSSASDVTQPYLLRSDSRAWCLFPSVSLTLSFSHSPELQGCLENTELCWKGSKCHASRSGREKERAREIVYLALLVTVLWLAASSHALNLRKQPRQTAEWQLSHPVRLPKRFCPRNTIGPAQTNR